MCALGRSGIRLLALLLVTALAPTATATPYTWDFEAVVTQTFGDAGPLSSMNAAGFVPGAVVSGHIEFDLVGSGTNLGTPPGQGLYTQSAMSFYFATPAAAFTSYFEYPSVQVSVPATGKAIYLVEVPCLDAPRSPYQVSFELILTDSLQQWISSVDFLPTPPPLALLDPYDPSHLGGSTSFQGFYHDPNSLNGNAFFQAQLTRLVPEPCTFTLLSLAGLLGAARRRR